MLVLVTVAIIVILLLSGRHHAVVAFSPVQSTPLSLRSDTTTSSFSTPPISLHMSTTDDEVAKLLAKAKALREEAAIMSGKSIEQMENERQLEKTKEVERQIAIEKARSEREEAYNIKSRNDARILPVPDDAGAMIQQAASAVERAFEDGITRQTVQFALLGKDELMSGELNDWIGGAKQMYREAGRPLTESLLREIRAYAAVVVSGDESSAEQLSNKSPPEVVAKDIWDFDGSAVITAKSAAGSHGDVQAIVFPNTDTKYLTDIESLSKEVGSDRLLLLVNPFWKDVESWGFNILAPNGKRRAQEVIFDVGYDVTYAVLRFSVRGEDCVAIKAYPYDWQLYAYREDPSWFNKEFPVWLGSSNEEPKSAQFTELLNNRPEFKMSKNMRQMQRMMGNDDQ